VRQEQTFQVFKTWKVCSRFVEALLAQRIPCVIATAHDVVDSLSVQFARIFYRSLVARVSLFCSTTNGRIFTVRIQATRYCATWSRRRGNFYNWRG